LPNDRNTKNGKYNIAYIIIKLSDSNSSLGSDFGFVCKICGLSFFSQQALAAHVDSEHPEAEQPEIL
jgi:hypothetical protein